MLDAAETAQRRAHERQRHGDEDAPRDPAGQEGDPAGPLRLRAEDGDRAEGGQREDGAAQRARAGQGTEAAPAEHEHAQPERREQEQRGGQRRERQSSGGRLGQLRRVRHLRLRAVHVERAARAQHRVQRGARGVGQLCAIETAQVDRAAAHRRRCVRPGEPQLVVQPAFAQPPANRDVDAGLAVRGERAGLVSLAASGSIDARDGARRGAQPVAGQVEGQGARDRLGLPRRHARDGVELDGERGRLRPGRGVLRVGRRRGQRREADAGDQCARRASARLPRVPVEGHDPATDGRRAPWRPNASFRRETRAAGGRGDTAS